MTTRSAYTVSHINERYEVIAPSGISVMSCSNKSSAEHYATLFSSAYQAGYKQAIRDNREDH